MRCLIPLVLGFCLVTLALTPAAPPLIPGLDLRALCDHSDVIVVGRALHVREGKSTTVVIQGKSFPGRHMLVELSVERVMKGRAEGTALTFSFSVPSVPIVSFGYEEVSVGQFGIFFLRKSDGGHEVLDPYHPFVIAAPGAPQASGNLLDQVTAEVTHVLRSVQVSSDVKEQALWVLNNVRTPVATAAIRAATRNQPLSVRLIAIGALLARNDISELDAAEDTLLHPPQNVNQNLVAGVASAIRFGVKDPRAIPTLARLLKSGDVNVRRGAASALRSTQDQDAIKPLAQALYDTDGEVLYQAVIGLAEITGTTGEWAPASDTFLKNPQRYLDHWRDWAKANK